MMTEPDSQEQIPDDVSAVESEPAPNLGKGGKGKRVFVRADRSRGLRYRHPWIFSGALSGTDGDPEDGDIVKVCRADGTPLGSGFYNSASKIAVRVVTWDPRAVVDDEFLAARISRAVDARNRICELGDTNACRLVHSEADGLPGLVVDRYGDHLVVQLQTKAIDRLQSVVVDALRDKLSPTSILHRPDEEYRSREGLEGGDSVLYGDAPTNVVEIREAGFGYQVDLREGSKTGFYLDQRRNRIRAARYARGNVLDCFSYSGAFGIHLRKGGAETVTHIDSSESALDLARANVEMNFPGTTDHEFVAGNAFEVLRGFRDRARTFDVIVCDPPKLAQNRSQIRSASRAYKDINLLAMKLLEPGGHLVTFSCSGAVTLDHFQSILFHASLDAERDVRVVERLGQGEDHPVALPFPESEYLKGVVLAVD